jgi:two-component system cell cycle response regulator DivK
VDGSLLQLAGRIDQHFGADADLVGDVDKVRLMRFEEGDHCAKQGWVGGSLPQLIRPESGQVEEATGPPFLPKRCRKRRKSKRQRIVWRLRSHGLNAKSKRGGRELAKILIVEDNALNIKLFCDLLAAHGHQPEAVTDSRNALEIAREFGPDLVITDIQLPHVSGLELIRLLRADEQLSNVPIMAVTAYSALGDEERIRGAGAQAYVSKPISVVKFAQTVEELLPKTEPAEQDA